MREMFRAAVAATALAGLSACASSDLVETWDSYYTFPEGYAERSAATVAAVDWSTAETREVVILEKDVRPAFVNMTAGKPYVLRVVNTEDVTRSFAAPDFFQSAAVAGVEGYGADRAPRITSLALAPRQTRELRVVPLEAGRYRFSNESGGIYVPWAEGFTWSQGAYGAQVGVLVVDGGEAM